MTCDKVVIFYEKHTDKTPALVIKNLTSLLKSIGIKSYCFEEPSNESKEELLQISKSLLQGLKPYEKISSFDDILVQKVLARGMLVGADSSGNPQPITPQSHFSQEDKVSILNYIKKSTKEMSESMEVTISLMLETDERNLHFCTMDLPRADREKLEIKDIDELQKISIRNEYMKERILEQCKEGDVLALVGASHFKLADLLRDKGVSVKEYYIASDPISINKEDIGDHCLRMEQVDYNLCGDVNFNGLVIDLYNNPELNPTELISPDLSILNSIHDEL